ncbi:Mitochondrial chaperone BCS1 [Senna tora]|uniref:Mitochondrial chaperone BCS1 n=1 Tax=Senna tora TaxID=362788 RepID=A0A834WWG5_9FABA|nr:Mitochondrial chaperone BCS1 [Senna tora]
MRKSSFKNRRMPLKAASTRYSLVKGERIVRFVLTAWLRDFCTDHASLFIVSSILKCCKLHDVGHRINNMGMGVAPPTKRNLHKNRRMPLNAASTRYSLVKGERIVRSVLNAWLRAFD